MTYLFEFINEVRRVQLGLVVCRVQALFDNLVHDPEITCPEIVSELVRLSSGALRYSHQ